MKIRSQIVHQLLAGVVFLAAASPLFSSPHPLTASLTITNNVNLEIRHVYLAPVGAENNWGPDQLNHAIAIGGSYTLNLSCEGSHVRVIAEDQDGCFYYQTASCSDNGGWTINNDSPRDCGSE